MTKARENSDYTGLAADIVAGDTAARAGRKNLIINGSFQISQRGNYTSATGLTSSWTYYLDRFKTRINNISGNLTHKVDQTVDGKLTDTVRLDATSTASGYINLLQQFEDLQKLKGQSVTFSAWVKSNNTNAKLVLHRDGSNAQTATTPHTGGGGWELLTATVTLATTITSVGLYCGILANATGNVSITSGDYFEMAFVQLELGSVATDFEHRSYGEELALCQRYYQINNNGMGRFNSSGNNWAGSLGIKSPMRATPSLTLLNATNAIDELYVSRRSIDSSPSTFSLYDVVTGTGGTYNGGQFVVSAVGGSSGIGTLQAGFISLDAEL